MIGSAQCFRALEAQPNPGHLALAMFSLPSVRKIIAPGTAFTLITQNVDGLSRRAFAQVASTRPELADEVAVASGPDGGSTSILEMHGRLFDVVCTSDTCSYKEQNLDSPVCPALAGSENVFARDEPEPHIDEKDLPRCKKCGSLARPGVVWFGEKPWFLEEIDELLDKADLCIVVGTSSTASTRFNRPEELVLTGRHQVYPAAGYAYAVKENGGKVAVFNLDRSEGDEDADFLFLGPAETTLPKALGLGEV